MWRLVGHQPARLAFLSGSAFLGGAAEAAFLVLVTKVALAIADGSEVATDLVGRAVGLREAVILAAGLLLFRLAAVLFGASTSASLTASVALRIKRELADAYLHSSWEMQQGEASGRLQQLVTAFAQEALRVVSACAATLTSSLNLVAMIAVSLFVSPAATVIVIFALAVLAGILSPIRRRIRLRSQSAARKSMQFASAVSELGDLGLEMQTYGVRDQFSVRIAELIGQETTARRRSDSLSASLPGIYTSFAYGALLAGLGIAVYVGVGSIAALGAVMLVMLRSLSYGQQLQVASGTMMSSLPYLDELDATLERYRGAVATTGLTPLARVEGIAVHEVSFHYEPGRPVLEGVTFDIGAGEVVGVIGPSGAGKSTLVQLLLGVRDPSKGRVTVGAVDLRDVRRDSWAHLVAFVAQDARLITGTIADNIRFFREGIDDDALRAAAEAANVLGDIEAMPQGFDSHLGQRGVQLSGGQRQRLSIARALVGQPSFLILDEPTSALDVESEALIRATIAELRGKVTVVVIAHRMSTVDICDRIMVVERGRVVAFDDPQVLRAGNEFYRNALELSGMG